MKREILRYEEHEDGSYTKVEKVTQTPEDGFVKQESFVPMRGTRYFKGHVREIHYETTNPKIVQPLLILAFVLFALLFGGVGALLAFLAEDPEAKRSLTGMTITALLFIGVCFLKVLQDMRKKKKKRQQKEQEQTGYKEL